MYKERRKNEKGKRPLLFLLLHEKETTHEDSMWWFVKLLNFIVHLCIDSIDIIRSIQNTIKITNELYVLKMISFED